MTNFEIAEYKEELLIMAEEGMLDSFFEQDEIMLISEEILRDTVRNRRSFDMWSYFDALDEFSVRYEENENITKYFFEDESYFVVIKCDELTTYAAFDKDRNLLFQFDLSKTGTVDIITSN